MKRFIDIFQIVILSLSISFQELRSREAEIDDKQREQRIADERLKQREAELAEREIDLLQRELNMMIQQQQKQVDSAHSAPTPKTRKGHFKKSRLKLLKKETSLGSGSSGVSLGAGLPGSTGGSPAGQNISAPSGRIETFF